MTRAMAWTPPSPMSSLIRAALRRQIQKISPSSTKIMIGASISVSVEYGTEPGCVDAVALLMKAMVPGPAVPGSASGTIATLTGLRCAKASALAAHLVLGVEERGVGKGVDRKGK